MSDIRIVGKVESYEPGKFENQYTITIRKQDDTEQKATVYSKKKDGGISAVWPLVTDSIDHSTVLAWTGSSREVDTNYGRKTYHTITYGRGPTDAELVTGPDWSGALRSVPAPATEPAVASEDTYEPTVEKYGGRGDQEAKIEDVIKRVLTPAMRAALRELADR